MTTTNGFEEKEYSAEEIDKSLSRLGDAGVLFSPKAKPHVKGYRHKVGYTYHSGTYTLQLSRDDIPKKLTELLATRSVEEIEFELYEHDDANNAWCCSGDKMFELLAEDEIYENGFLTVFFFTEFEYVCLDDHGLIVTNIRIDEENYERLDFVITDVTHIHRGTAFNELTEFFNKYSS